MRRNKTIHRIWVILFCIVVSLTGMYTSGRKIDSSSAYTDLANTLSAAARRDKSFDAAGCGFLTVADEIKSSITVLSKGSRSIRLNSENSNCIKKALSAVSLTTWTVLIVSQWNVIVDRMYLIFFMHDSDGKKGDGQFFSWHNQI